MPFGGRPSEGDSVSVVGTRHRTRDDPTNRNLRPFCETSPVPTNSARPDREQRVLEPHGRLSDVAGLRIGHHRRLGRGWASGTTVIECPIGTVGSVDVRGGAPGTRETDLLRPENLVRHVDAICLSGGSAFGLAAADGVSQELFERGRGFSVGPDERWVVPIVPAAVIFDLARGGDFRNHPDRDFGRRALRAARVDPGWGTVGAGTGARAGWLQGGVGTASTTVEGFVVSALAVVNSVGSVIDPSTGAPWTDTRLALRRPTPNDRRRLVEHLRSAVSSTGPMVSSATSGAAAPSDNGALNTTIGVVATDADLDKSECLRLAGSAQDGLARAIRPAHGLNDGDAVFALATGRRRLPTGSDLRPFLDPEGRARRLNQILAAAADVFAEACAHAVVAATSRPGGPPAYRDLCPSAFRSHAR